MNSVKYIFIVIPFLFSLCSCKSKADEKQNDKNHLTVDTVAGDETINEVPLLTDATIFPTDSLFSVKVLTAGTFHGDEIWEGAEKVKWYGLFRNSKGFYIEETKLRIKKVYDPVLDEETNEKTGCEIQTSIRDTCYILIESNHFVTPGDVKPAMLQKDEILPGDTLHVNYLGIEYRIFATGDTRKSESNPNETQIFNYKLYISATINNTLHRSLLVAQPDFDDQMIKILFAGDIDSDGILDLIIDVSANYNAFSPTLFLSRPAENGGVVAPVGGHTAVGC